MTGSALPAMVDIDELHFVGQGIERRFVVAVVATGTAVQDEGDRLFHHARAIGNQTRAVDIEPDFSPANTRLHSILPFNVRKAD